MGRPNIYVYLMSLCIWDSLLLVSAALLYAVPTVLFHRKRIVGFYIRVPIFPSQLDCSFVPFLWLKATAARAN